MRSSIIAVRPSPTVAAPSSATGAIEAPTRALAVQLAPSGAARPAGRRPRKVLDGSEPDGEALYRRLNEKLLTRRMGTYDEVATAYLYLTENGFSG
jgi:NAD(P)-dependent dehydrogenase (short-subunit alcohol dehydrogenase family)